MSLFLVSYSSPMISMIKKLGMLRLQVQKWETDGKAENEKELTCIEEEFQRLSGEVDKVFFSTKRKDKLLFWIQIGGRF